MSDSNYTHLVVNLQQALAASEKVVNVEISLDDLSRMKKSGYRLCFAKKVNDSYNVVWESYDDYLHTNIFSWTPQYELFGTNSFSGGVEVKATTNIETCGLGETCLLDEYGILEPATTGGPDVSLTLLNEYDPIHPGVNQLAKGIDGTTRITPIYVAESQMVTGEAILTPKESIRIWFQQDIESSTMISEAISKYIDLDLTRTNEMSCKYEDGKWSVV